MAKHAFEKCVYTFGVKAVQNLWVHRAACMRGHGVNIACCGAE